MRSCSWFLIVLWVLKLSLGSVMAMPVVGMAQAAAQVSSTTHAEHAITPKLSQPDCHGPWTTLGDRSWPHEHTTSDDAGKARSAAPTDCHHCCAMAWDNLTVLALHRLPAGHPVRMAQGWQSVSLRPDLRPPIS